MSKNISQFHLEEFSSSRQETIFYLKSAQNSLVYTFVGNAAVMSVLISSDKPIDLFLMITSWLPFLVTIIGLFYFINIVNWLHKIANYTLKLENKFGEDGLGWEKFLNGIRIGRSWFKYDWIYVFSFFVQLCAAMWIAAHNTLRYSI